MSKDEKYNKYNKYKKITNIKNIKKYVNKIYLKQVPEVFPALGIDPVLPAGGQAGVPQAEELVLAGA